ncbi:MAG: class II fructose-bisphosphate aldolase [Anaerolineales bacterium]
MRTIAEIVHKAYSFGLAIPAFNIPYLPMMEPVVRAVIDSNSFALVAVARLEWLKFESRDLRSVAEEFAKWRNPDHVRLHLDHVPVIDEDDLHVDYLPIFREALALGYESIMIDGSRLPLDENIRATCQAVELAHAAGVPVEAELGAVFGHAAGQLPPYEELFASGKGFTDVGEAGQFVYATHCDWLSVAVGNIHGAIVAGQKDRKKVEARLDLDRLKELKIAAGIPLVLHGGSGIRQENVRLAMQDGIAKINVATEIRQTYEMAFREVGSISRAQDVVYTRTRWVLEEWLGVAGIQKAVVEQ